MPADKDPVPDFSDVRGGSSSSDPRRTGPEPQAPADRTYVVKKGDSLSKIAKAVYGDAGKWTAIHQANRDTIANPDLIHPGQVIKLPNI
jgi:nucleoid-associated protein YgaU